jgi:hypothetical protein
MFEIGVGVVVRGSRGDCDLRMRRVAFSWCHVEPASRGAFAVQRVLFG